MVPPALGVSLAARGRPEKAGPLIGCGVAFLRSRGQPAEVAMALLHQGSVLRALGERERSQAAITEARAVIGSCPDPCRNPGSPGFLLVLHLGGTGRQVVTGHLPECERARDGQRPGARQAVRDDTAK